MKRTYSDKELIAHGRKQFTNRRVVVIDKESRCYGEILPYVLWNCSKGQQYIIAWSNSLFIEGMAYFKKNEVKVFGTTKEAKAFSLRLQHAKLLK